MKATLSIDPKEIHHSEQTYQFHGYSVTVNTPQDVFMGPPWEEHDGHGEVSDWVDRDKRPGERELSRDRTARRLFYDFAGAIATAKRDGWGLAPVALDLLFLKLKRQPTRAEVIEAAVESDFEHCRGWATDKWYWRVVSVEVFKNGILVGSDSIGGVEGCGDYWKELAAEMAETIINTAEAEILEVLYWNERGIVTV